MKRLLLSLLVCLVVQPALAAPAAPFQILDAAPLVVRGVIDPTISEWATTVRVQGGAQPIGAILGLPSDLVSLNDPAARIERSTIRLQNAETLAANEIRDLRLVVAAVPQPGTYAGTVQFVVQGAPITTALTLSFQVEVAIKPQIIPVENALTLETTTCWCWPWSATQPWFGYLAQQGSAATTITSATVLLRGQHTGTSINPAALQIPLPQPLMANGDTAIAITAQRSALPADQYTGLLRLQTNTGTLVAPITLTINVKHGFLWAVLTLLAGIVAGRFVRFMQSPDVQRGLVLSKALEVVRVIASTLTAPAVRAALDQQIAQLEQQIDDPSTDADALRAAINEWHSRAIMLRDVQKLDVQVQTLEKNEATRDLMRALADAEKTVLNEPLDQANAVRAALYSQYQTILSDLSAQSKDIALPTVEATPLPTIARPPAPAAMPSRWQRTVERVRRLLERLIGIAAPASARARYRIYRPVAGALFLLVLVIVGLQTKYAANPTFGAQWSNYWDLFLWGVTADVVNRALIGQLGDR